MRTLCLLFLFWLSAQLGVGQVFQLSGIVFDAEVSQPVPFARVSVNKTRQGAFANETGFFSVPVEAGDTLYFSRMGYLQNKLAVDEILADPDGAGLYRYTVHEMTPDPAFTTPTITIFPYRNAYEATLALQNMPLQTVQPIIEAEGNLQSEALVLYQMGLPLDGTEQLSYVEREYLRNYATRSFRPNAPIFNTEMVRELVQYVAKKSDERKRRIYSYWGEE